MLSTCPICLTCDEKFPSECMYANSVCKQCVELAVDKNNKPMYFANTCEGGGFITVQYNDVNKKPTFYSGWHECFIKGVPCYADECRYGGIVVTVMRTPSLRKEQPCIVNLVYKI